MTQPTRIRPYRIVGQTVFDALGSIVAFGGPELCRAVVEGRMSTIQRQGDLFDVQRPT